VWSDDDRATLCGIGTLIGNNMSETTNWIVFGSGVGYLPPPADFGSERWTVLCVRGPLSAHVLGLASAKVVTDSAALISLLPEYAPLPESERGGVVFMPHHLALEAGEWRRVCAEAGIEFLDPEQDDRESISRIRRARLVIADAMHAAIIADTLRVPWVPVVTSPEINSFKWMDWTSSMEMPYKPIVLPPSSHREVVRNWFLRYRGKRHYLPNATNQDAIDYVMRQRRLSERIWPPFAHKASSAASRIAVAAVALIERPGDAMRRALRTDAIETDPLIRAAADALRAASLAAPSLSDEAVFLTKKAQLRSCLERIGEAQGYARNSEKQPPPRN
jgi:succinoglycan biosynthesis protein ExoV